MKKRLVGSMFLSLLVVLAQYVIASPALAADSSPPLIYFFIDCYDEAVKDAGTNNPINAEVFRDGKLIANWKIDKLTCGPYGRREEYQLPGPVDDGNNLHRLKLRLKATGGDAAWIDRVTMCTPSSNLPPTFISGPRCGSNFMEFGRDGHKGWCLSTDAKDSFGKGRQDGKCDSCVEFRGSDNRGGACK